MINGEYEVTQNRFGINGEKLAKKMLRKHFTMVRAHKLFTDPFDYTAIDRLTGERVAVEVKTIKRETGKLVHITTEAMERKLQYMNQTNRKGIVLVIIKNRETKFYLARLQNHISSGHLMAIN